MKKRGFCSLGLKLCGVLGICLLLVTPLQVKAENALKGTRATWTDVVEATDSNKKGIQGSEFWAPEGHAWNGSDEEFKNSVNHVYLNLELNQIIKTDGTGEPYVYNGKTYYFNYESYLKIFEWRIREFRAAGKAVTIEVLMGWSDDPQLQKLIYPSGREAGHFYYAYNVQDAEAVETLNATFHYLMDLFGQSDCFVQNWIIGNEITVPQHYNYSGTYDAQTNIDIAVKSFDILYQAIQNNSPYSRGYICLAHNWNENFGGLGIPTKQFIDGFAAREAGKNWNIAYHPYSNDMSKTMWSKEATRDFSHELETNYVGISNIEVLTNYLKNTYGTSHRVILSELGYNAGAIGEEAQAASIAYAYYAAARNDMVDALIYADYTDNMGATGGGMSNGLFSSNGQKRLSYDVFKYMDTDQAASKVNGYLRYITPNDNGVPISSWTDDILWKASPTSVVLTDANIYVPGNQSGPCVAMAMAANTSGAADLEYRWLAYNQSTGIWQVVSGWRLNHNVLEWYPSQEGNYLVCGEVRVAGNTSSIMSQTVGYQFGTIPTVKKVGVYLWQYENKKIEGGAVVNDDCDKSSLQYRWLVYDVNNNNWILASDWSYDYGIHYYPASSGDYLVHCEVKDIYGNMVSTDVGVNYRHVIKATCQIPYEGGKFLIGIESFGNPNNEYSYEMLILDCNLFLQGLPAWVYTTGQTKTVGNTLWTMWAPLPGNYWTLFRVYDKDGNQIDEVCYGFTNQ